MSACGIDFGTSNSTVAYHDGSKIGLLALEGDKTTLPSVIFFNADLDEVNYGRAALTAYLDGYEGRLMRSMKSLLGTSLLDGYTEVQGRSLSYKHLLSQFIGALKQQAELSAGENFDRAVFGRPVHFIDDDQKADAVAEQSLRDIAHEVGFKEVHFQFEPIAAALDYEARIQDEQLVLVVDIGGGTSDFSVIRLSPERSQKINRQSDILSNTGVHIGGTDFDKYLSLQHFMPMLGMGGILSGGMSMPSANYFNLATWHTINLVYTQKVIREIQDLCHDVSDAQLRFRCECFLNLIEQRDGHWLAIKAEESKIALSSEAEVELALERLKSRNTSQAAPILRINQQQLELAISPLFVQLRNTVEEAVRRADIRADQIDTIFFTGGASGVRGLRSYLQKMMPQAALVEGDSFGSIGTGLAWEARRRFA